MIALGPGDGNGFRSFQVEIPGGVLQIAIQTAGLSAAVGQIGGDGGIIVLAVIGTAGGVRIGIAADQAAGGGAAGDFLGRHLRHTAVQHQVFSDADETASVALARDGALDGDTVAAGDPGKLGSVLHFANQAAGIAAADVRRDGDVRGLGQGEFGSLRHQAHQAASIGTGRDGSHLHGQVALHRQLGVFAHLAHQTAAAAAGRHGSGTGQIVLKGQNGPLAHFAHQITGSAGGLDGLLREAQGGLYGKLGVFAHFAHQPAGRAGGGHDKVVGFLPCRLRVVRQGQLGILFHGAAEQACVPGLHRVPIFVLHGQLDGTSGLHGADNGDAVGLNVVIPGIVDSDLPGRAGSRAGEHICEKCPLRVFVGQPQIAVRGVIHGTGSLGGKIVEKRMGQGQAGFRVAVEDQGSGEGGITAAQARKLICGQVAGFDDDLNGAVRVFGGGQRGKAHQLRKGVDGIFAVHRLRDHHVRHQRKLRFGLRFLRLLGGLGGFLGGLGGCLGGFLRGRRRFRLLSSRGGGGLLGGRRGSGRCFRRLSFLAHQRGRRRSILLRGNRQHNHIQKQACRQHQRSQSDPLVHRLGFLSGKWVLETRPLIRRRRK